MRDLTVTNAAKMNQERAAAPLNNTCSLNCDQEQVQEGKKELSGNLHQKLHASSAAPPDNDCKESELEKGKENKQEKQPSLNMTVAHKKQKVKEFRILNN